MSENIYRNTLIVSILIVPFLALMDILGSRMWCTVGCFGGETYLTAMPLYMKFFWTFAHALIIIVAIVYYLSQKDLSETIAIAITPILLLWGGFEDFLMYTFQGLKLQNLPWLMNTPVSLMSRLLGYDTVTPLGLILNMLVFALIAGLAVIILEKQKW